MNMTCIDKLYMLRLRVQEVMFEQLKSGYPKPVAYMYFKSHGTLCKQYTAI